MHRSMMIWAWFAILITISLVRKLHTSQVQKRATLSGIPIAEASMMVLWGIAAGVFPFMYFFSSWLDFADYPFDIPLQLQLTGVLTFAFATWLLHRSHVDLGTYWAANVEFQPEHQLIVKGVYKRIRHPMYAAHLLWGVAQSLVFPNILAGPLALLLMSGIMLLRVPREERALCERFGTAYRQYAAHTGRIVPRCSAHR